MDDVQTSVLTLPSLNESSASMRASFDSEPWWTAMGSFSFLKRAPTASADWRVLTNISVDLFSLMSVIIVRIWAAMSGSVSSFRASVRSESMASGYITWKSSDLDTETSTICASRSDPARKRATSSGLPTVADSPMRRNSEKRASRSRAMASWVPRLEDASSCTSSTTT